MMKMAMRLDKSQVTSFYKLSAAGSIKRDPLLMAGYTTYTCLLIGAAGGRAGDAHGSYDANIVYGAGGGGGGSLQATGRLLDLDSTIQVVVGKKGANGADSNTRGVYAGNGGDGGNSSFGPHAAYGGQGAKGGMEYDQNSFMALRMFSSIGGDGGGNSGGFGGRGTGGHGKTLDTSNGGTGPNPVGTIVDAVQGDWSGVPGNGGGHGGGGGRGFTKRESKNDMGLVSTGAAGNVGTATSDAAGQAAQGNNGGNGGGADAWDILGYSEEYGGPGQDGIVIVRFS